MGAAVVAALKGFLGVPRRKRPVLNPKLVCIQYGDRRAPPYFLDSKQTHGKIKIEGFRLCLYLVTCYTIDTRRGGRIRWCYHAIFVRSSLCAERLR